jgi:MFS family permease
MGLSTAWQGVLAGRLLDRSGAGTFAAPRDALVSLSTDERHRGRGFGLENLGQNAGAFLGPLLTVLLLYELQIEIRNIFYLAVIPALVAFAIALVLREPRMQSRPTGSVILYPTRLPVDYWKFLLVIALFSVGNSSNSFFILRTQELSASLLTTILTYSGFNLVAAIMSFPIGWLSDRWERRRLLLGTFAVSLLVYGGFAYAQSLAFAILLFLAYGFYEAGFRSVGRAIASEFVGEELRASALAWFSATAGLFQLVASLVGGLLWDQFGHTSTFIYGAISSATGILVGVLVFRRGHVAQASNQIR